MHKKASEILRIRFDCTQIHHFVDYHYVMSRFGRQGSAFVTDNFDLSTLSESKPVKILTLVQDRLSDSRISLVSRLNGTIPIRLSQNERCCDCAWPDNLRIWIEGS